MSSEIDDALAVLKGASFRDAIRPDEADAVQSALEVMHRCGISMNDCNDFLSAARRARQPHSFGPKMQYYYNEMEAVVRRSQAAGQL